MTNSADEIARAAASELAAKYGDEDILEKTETILKHGPPPRPQAARQDLGGVDPVAIAILIVHCAHFGVTVYQTVKEKAELAARIKADPQIPISGTTGTQITDVVGAVSEQISKDRDA